MKSATLVILICFGFVFLASGTELVTKNQEQQLIKVLKKWKGVYENGIKAKEFMAKRGVQGQQQAQQQNVNNNNAINIHLHQLQSSVNHYNQGYGGYQAQRQGQYGGYGGYQGQYQNQYQGSYNRPSYYPQYNRYPSPHGGRRGSSSRSSSRKR